MLLLLLLRMRKPGLEVTVVFCDSRSSRFTPSLCFVGRVCFLVPSGARLHTRFLRFSPCCGERISPPVLISCTFNATATTGTFYSVTCTPIGGHILTCPFSSTTVVLQILPWKAVRR